MQIAINVKEVIDVNIVTGEKMKVPGPLGPGTLRVLAALSY